MCVEKNCSHNLKCDEVTCREMRRVHFEVSNRDILRSGKKRRKISVRRKKKKRTAKEQGMNSRIIMRKLR